VRSDTTWPHLIVLEPSNGGLAMARRMVRLGAPVTVVEGEPIAAHSRGVKSVIEHYTAEGASWRQALGEISRNCSEGVVLTPTGPARGLCGKTIASRQTFVGSSTQIALIWR
jgi:hypothetical protein